MIAHSPKSEGTLWCVCGEKILCLDAKKEKYPKDEENQEEIDSEMQEEEEDAEEENLSTIPIIWLPFLLACDKEKRLIAALSGQLEDVRFEVDERVLIAKRGTEELEEATITGLRDGNLQFGEPEVRTAVCSDL